MTSSGIDRLHPHGREFEPFLHASVGEDRNGYLVTVLSTLARMGLDPWQEAAELAPLGREAASARLGRLLARFRDVPALGYDHGSVARKLTLLLPDPATRTVPRAGSFAVETRWISAGAIWVVVAVLLILVQLMFAGGPGSGE